MKRRDEGSIFEHDPVSEGSLEWLGSPSSQLSDEVRELAWQSMPNVAVDASDRKLIWDDGKRLSIDQSVQRLHGDYPEFPLALIEDHLIGWLELEFAPERYSQAQLGELDRLTEEWIDDHIGQRKVW